jgi:hypothetical protein
MEIHGKYIDISISGISKNISDYCGGKMWQRKIKKLVSQRTWRLPNGEVLHKQDRSRLVGSRHVAPQKTREWLHGDCFIGSGLVSGRIVWENQGLHIPKQSNVVVSYKFDLKQIRWWASHRKCSCCEVAMNVGKVIFFRTPNDSNKGILPNVSRDSKKNLSHTSSLIPTHVA